MRFRPALTTLAATTALLATTAGPAQAETQVRADPGGDVAFTNPSASPGPLADTVDILALQGAHRTNALVFRFTVADLAASQRFDALTAEVRIRTLGGREYAAVMTAESGRPQVFLNDGTTGGVDCDGLAGRIVLDRDQLVVTVPRSCVRNPRSVRFGGATSSFGDDGGGQTDVHDDARRDGGSGGVPIRLGTRELRRA